MLYTYTAHDLIFPTEEKEWNRQKLVSIPGGQLLVERDISENELENSYRIVRLIATEPNLYLDSRYAPGQPFSFYS